MNKVVYAFVLLLLVASCRNEPKTGTVKSSVKEEKAKLRIPEFNADSAYDFVAKQVGFGPRVPGTEAHAKCEKWLVDKLKSYGAEVVVQTFKARAFNDKILTGKNIIASFNPDKRKRIMLSAHWDSRPFADHDPNPENHYKAIDGANDGASGVGILLEMARNFAMEPPAEVGVDIFFWDLEDYGEHNDDKSTPKPDSWGLGSQYWSKNKHNPGYQAAYGILLDMVGAANPTFTKEYYSMQYAPAVVDKVWREAQRLGFGDVFLNEKAGAVTDDHVYINQNAGIPTIDIIHYVPNSSSGFFPQWHTLGDNMDIISKPTLEIVGKVLMNVVYKEN